MSQTEYKDASVPFGLNFPISFDLYSLTKYKWVHKQDTLYSVNTPYLLIVCKRFLEFWPFRANVNGLKGFIPLLTASL